MKQKLNYRLFNINGRTFLKEIWPPHIVHSLVTFLFTQVYIFNLIYQFQWIFVSSSTRLQFDGSPVSLTESHQECICQSVVSGRCSCLEPAPTESSSEVKGIEKEAVPSLEMISSNVLSEKCSRESQCVDNGHQSRVYGNDNNAVMDVFGVFVTMYDFSGSVFSSGSVITRRILHTF